MSFSYNQMPSADNYIQSDVPTQNNGSLDTLKAGEYSGVIYRTLVKFDFSPIPAGCTLLVADFNLNYVNRIAGRNVNTFGIYRLKRNWIEAQSTWNIFSTGNNWQTAGGFGVNDCEQTTIGTFTVPSAGGMGFAVHLNLPAVAEMINGTWPNYGFLIKSLTESSDDISFRSKEYVGSNQITFYATWNFSGRQFQSIIMG